jgi:hypothetical protein
VLIRPGAGVAVSKYPQVGQQSYVFRNMTDTAVPVTPTGASAGRSDLLIARVRDPSVSTSGDPAPTSIPNGPYIMPHVVSNVPNTTKSVHQITPSPGFTGITLARLDIPANTAAITQAMIKDLRSTATKATPPQPAPEAEGTNEAEAVLYRNMVKCNGSALQDENLTYINWPSEAVWNNVLIPKWCTHIAFFCIMNPTIDDGDFFGRWRLDIGGVATSEAELNWNYEADKYNKSMREVAIHGGTYVVPAAQRGKTVTIRSQAKSDNINYNSIILADARTYFRIELDFLQVPALS